MAVYEGIWRYMTVYEVSSCQRQKPATVPNPSLKTSTGFGHPWNMLSCLEENHVLLCCNRKYQDGTPMFEVNYGICIDDLELVPQRMPLLVLTRCV